MGIDASWVTEDLEAIQDVFDPRLHLSKLALSRWPSSSSTCLRFIDAYGDTYFNQAQIPVLLAELRGEVLVERDSELRAHLEKVVRLVERAVGATHTYVRFTGD